MELVEPLKELAEPLKEQIEPLKESVKPLKESVESLNETVELLKEKIELLKKPVEPLKESVELLKEKIEPLKEPVEPLKESVESLKEPVEPLKEKIEPLKEPVESLKESVESLKETVEPLKEKIEPLKEPVEPLKESVESLKEPIEPLKKQIESLKEPIKPLNESVESLIKLIEPLKKLVEPSKKPVEPLKEPVKLLKEPIENDKSSEHLPSLKVGKEFIEVLESSHTIMMTVEEGNPSKRMIEMIGETKANMDRLYQNIILSENEDILSFVFLAQAYLHLSRTYAGTKDNSGLDIANSHLNKCLDLLEGKQKERKAILIVVNAYHFLGSLYHKWHKYEQSLMAFEKALQQYMGYNEGEEKYLAPINDLYQFIHGESSDPEYSLEGRCITILQDLLIGTRKVDDKDIINPIIDKVITHKRKFLKRILYRPLSTRAYVSWASQSISLADILIKFERFTGAKNHLAAASFLMEKYYQKKYTKTDEQKHSTQKPSIFYLHQEMVSDINRCWGRYGLKLLQSSQANLLRKASNKSCEVCEFHSTVQVSEEQCNESSEFVDMMQDLKEFTVDITDQYFSCYRDATTVFTTTMKHFNKALEYFTPEHSLLEYGDIMQETAYAYKYLANYEKNETRQVKLLKQRLHILKKAEKKLDTKKNIDTLKPMWIEMAITNSNILDKITKKSRYDAASSLNDIVSDEPKTLVKEILDYWQLHIDSSS